MPFAGGVVVTVRRACLLVLMLLSLLVYSSRNWSTTVRIASIPFIVDRNISGVLSRIK